MTTIDTPAWVRDAVFYQIFPDRFAASPRIHKPGQLESWDSPPTNRGFKGGDLLGIVEHLDHIERLGANALYLNPVFSSASNHRYHTYDYMQVDPLLGGDAALRELLDACHGRGMKVILDGVFNHASRGFWPFHHVLETGSSSPYRDWFHYDQQGLDAGRPLRAYASETELAATAAHAGHGESSFSRLGYDAWWGLPALPKLNTDNQDVRAYLFAVAEHWMRFGADGWRLDVPLEIRDEEFWREFRRRVRAVDPEAYIVAEIWHELPQYLQGDQYDAYMNYPLAYAIISYTAGRHLDLGVIAQQNEYRTNIRPMDGPAFGRALEHVLGLYRPEVTAVQFNLLGSHDTPRFRTVAGGDRDAVRLATLIQMTLPGAPSIYYGDEIGMEGRQDPDCRRSFPWEHQEVWDASLLEFVSRMASLRHAHRALRDGTYRLLGAVDGVVAYSRVDGEELFVVGVNAGESVGRLDVDLPDIGARTLVAERLTSGTDADDPWHVTDQFVVEAGPAAEGTAARRVSLTVPARAGMLLRAVRTT